jgi:glycine/D-amino acid oxidase-like deaminating enzyme
MTEPRDIAIVGAGVVGVCCARVLQRQGHRVTLYDPEAPGSGASFGNAGHIAIDHIRPLARLDILRQVPAMLSDPLGPLSIRWRDAPALLPWLTRFALASRPSQERRGTAALAALLRGSAAAWAEETRGSNLAGLFRAKGALVVYSSDTAFRAAAGERALLQSHGVAVETMDGDAARARAPGLAATIRAATYFPAAQHVGDPHGLVVGLADSFVRDGGRIERLPVTGFEIADGAIAALTTPSGSRKADLVVLAAGLASRRFGPQLGIKLPLVDERGYHVMIAPTGAGFEVPVTWGERGFVLTPMEAGIRLAGTVELAKPDVPPSWARAELLTRQARLLFPGLSGGETSRWMGMRPTLPDYLPAIGRAPRQRNLYFALGHQHIGLTTVAMTARLIGELVAGTPPAIDLAAFAPDRFS